jgi:hypothetical protein
VDGTGIKIGVLSDGVGHLTSLQSSGLLPPVTVLPGQQGLTGSEGTAMLEIVHALAPGSDLYFATAFGGPESFAQNIRDLHAAGCRVIIDDVSYFNESPFQEGPIAQAVAEVCAAGTLFFSSAGNAGNVDQNTSGTWEGDFRDGGPATLGKGGRIHDFGGVNYNTVIAGGGLRRVDLFWADKAGSSANDYDLYVLDASGVLVRSSTNVQDGDDDPYESLNNVEVGERIVVVKYSGDDRYLSLTTGRGRLAIGTSGATRGHNASPAPNAFGVAAVRVANPAVPFVAGETNHVEFFSSDGPRRMFFDTDGTPFTPGNFSSTGGRVFTKPDIAAANGVSTSVPAFPVFFGTSAAAPHAGAIAALLLSANPLLDPSEARALLAGKALDIEAPGSDRNAGAGVVMAYESLNPAPRLKAQATLVDANHNGSIDPNECVDIAINLVNLGSPMKASVTNITATLKTATPTSFSTQHPAPSRILHPEEPRAHPFPSRSALGPRSIAQKIPCSCLS